MLDNHQTPITTHQSLSWRVLSVSVQGSGHVRADLPCQDFHDWRLLPSGILVAAVADGAGSSLCPEVGSEIAARTSVSEMSARLESSTGDFCRSQELSVVLLESLEATIDALHHEAETRDISVRELATTLILVIATDDEIAVAQIGDGAVIVGENQNSIFALTIPENGEFINETRFITSHDALQTVQLKSRHGRVSHLAMLTDGLQMLALKMPDYTPHIPFFAPLFRFVSQPDNRDDGDSQLQAFLDSTRVRERTDDDMTLILAARSGESTCD